MVKRCRLIPLPKISDARGNLSFAEEENHVPFRVERVFWIYDVPGGEDRGGHAYKETEEFIIALSGSFDVVLDDGTGNVQTFQLNRSFYGLYVPQMIWRQMANFSTNSVAMVLTSTPYDVNDYVRDYEVFKMMK
jgi:dTDP-4-dehydrorhamnose 3,5-epimerase-like enzyme